MMLESFVAKMMSVNVYARLWHWGTDSAQHHVTFEQFLTQNEQFTDSFVESVLGNDLDFSIARVEVSALVKEGYDLKKAKASLVQYRTDVLALQKKLDAESVEYSGELIAILDDAVELCSKTLYLLRLK